MIGRKAGLRPRHLYFISHMGGILRPRDWCANGDWIITDYGERVEPAYVVPVWGVGLDTGIRVYNVNENNCRTYM